MIIMDDKTGLYFRIAASVLFGYCGLRKRLQGKCENVGNVKMLWFDLPKAFSHFHISHIFTFVLNIPLLLSFFRSAFLPGPILPGRFR